MILKIFNTETISHHFTFRFIFETEFVVFWVNFYTYKKTQRVAQKARNALNQIKLHLCQFLSF